MTTRPRTSWLLGALGGALLVLVGLPALRVSAAPTPPAGALEVTAASTGEIAVIDPGSMLRATELRAGGPAASGTTTIVNQTARTLRLTARVTPLADELDGRVRITIGAGDDALGSHVLGSRTPWPAQAAVLRPLERRVLRVTARPLDGDLAGRETQARLDLRTEVVR
ncbi:hypothetical protein LRS13_16805 [Svornostia abyssi]|uniref:Uncharacterized protein n=1 Tax=Svornostia abyssi TaxID=2898438 RepID=A0ABY5PCT2_9ACTN|nr:hypothetical protein LRS13_16805 [Parviterribacteraceae bacterium J379]